MGMFLLLLKQADTVGNEMYTRVKDPTLYMKLLFRPLSVAVVGASNDRSKWGYRVFPKHNKWRFSRARFIR